jgi:hypothetical protein
VRHCAIDPIQPSPRCHRIRAPVARIWPALFNPIGNTLKSLSLTCNNDQNQLKKFNIIQMSYRRSDELIRDNSISKIRESERYFDSFCALCQCIFL